MTKKEIKRAILYGEMTKEEAPEWFNHNPSSINRRRKRVGNSQRKRRKLARQ